MMIKSTVIEIGDSVFFDHLQQMGTIVEIDDDTVTVEMSDGTLLEGPASVLYQMGSS